MKRASVAGLVAEVWYPATLGSSEGRALARYDVRDDLPAEQAAKISDADAPTQPCDCVRDLPVDAAHGAFPLVVFIHGTAGFKTQNLENMVQWASRGFVVIAANHPGLTIGSFVGAGGTRDLARDVKAEIQAIGSGAGDLAAFAGRVDVTRIGLVGHSAGGDAVASLGGLPGVRVVIPLSAGAVPDGTSFQSTLFVSGAADGLVSPARVAEGFAKTDKRDHKRLVSIVGAAHTGVTSLCGIRNSAGKSILEVATAAGVLSGPLATFAERLFDCRANTTNSAELLAIVNEATTAALQETLQCDASAQESLAGLRAKFETVGDYRSEP